MLLRFEFSRMPHTSEMWNLARGFEDFYYGLLFATDDHYRAVDGLYETWVEMGLDLGIRSAPPRSEVADRVKLSIRSLQKRIDVTVSGGRADLVDQVASVVESLVNAPASTKALGAAERAAALGASGEVGSALATMTNGTSSGNLIVQSSSVLAAAWNRDIAAFSYPDIVRVTRDPQ